MVKVWVWFVWGGVNIGVISVWVWLQAVAWGGPYEVGCKYILSVQLHSHSDNMVFSLFFKLLGSVDVIGNETSKSDKI